MTRTATRTLLQIAGASIVAIAALSGCSKEEKTTTTTTPAGTTTTTTTTTTAPMAASAVATPASAPVKSASAPLKVAFAYVGPVGDGGWTFAHDNARKAVEKHFGDKVQTSFVEKVPEAADAERVFRDMAGQGNKLIFGTTFGYMEPMLKVAADLKDVKFEHATGYKQADNMRTYDSRTYEGAYMAGVIAGGMTKTNTSASSARSRFPRSSATSTASPSGRNRSTRTSRPRSSGSTSGSTRRRKRKPRSR